MIRRTTLLLVVLLLAACGNPLADKPSDKMTVPKLGACRLLTSADVTRPDNDSPTVPCSKKHNAQTFAIGTLPKSTGSSYSSKAHGRWVYAECTAKFARFLGVDESLAMRVELSWAWFRPSKKGWEKGARWFRCDAVGARTGSTALRPLPEDARGLFSGRPPDAWLTCVNGPGVDAGVKVPCSEKHTWRAATTIKLGQPTDAYPGDRLVQVRTRDFCQDSIGAWLNYPPEYDFGYTWFHEADWKAGNRRSICWARTNK